jgi:hypothetical protein
MIQRITDRAYFGLFAETRPAALSIRRAILILVHPVSERKEKTLEIGLGLIHPDGECFGDAVMGQKGFQSSRR